MKSSAPSARPNAVAVATAADPRSPLFNTDHNPFLALNMQATFHGHNLAVGAVIRSPESSRLQRLWTQ